MITIKGIIPLITFYASPVLGYVADRLGYKPTLLFTLVLASVEVVMFTLLPKYEAVARFKIGVDTQPADISASSLGYIW